MTGGVLVDISVWVDHFQRRNDAIVNLLALDLALTHPTIVTELARHAAGTAGARAD